MQRKYTEKIHAKRLLGMLSRPNTCRLCPAARRYAPNTNSIEDMWKGHPKACNICREFIGLPLFSRCPCKEIGKHRAARRTWIALEEKGYLED